MKVAVVGCGALGSFYGAKLCRLGCETHFLLRSDYEVVRRKGVRVRSRDGDFHVNPKCARTAEEIGVSDLVLIGLKTTANEQFGALLPPLVGAKSAILTLQNGLGNEEALARHFPVEQVMGGLAFVCLNRVSPGSIHHIDHGRIVIGEFQRWPEPRTHDIADRFRKSGVPCDVTDNLARAHWEKLVWNIPFNGLGVASSAGYENLVRGDLPKQLGPCLTTDKLLADERWANLVRELMMEIVQAARKLGFALELGIIEKQIERTSTMGAYKPSTLVDFERGQSLELESMFCEPLRQAERAGIETPRLRALVRVLEGLQGLNET
jgi:2-dehydropantoate 2-reductase